MLSLILTTLLLLCSTSVEAREPLYVVNGKVVADIKDIPQDDIESIDILPANEDTIATWGMEASEGVVLIHLIYDTPARHTADGYDSFTAYLSDNVEWDADMPAARVSLRLNIDTEGIATIYEVLQSTSRQFLKRVTRAIDSAPTWQPAMRDGEAIESIVLVNLQLPVGKNLPVEHAVIIR